MSYVAKCKKLVDKSGREIAIRSGRDDPRFRQQFRKTELCVFFQQGRCSKGAACTFAHGEADLNHVPDLTKTSLCKKWVVFSCRKASEACPFAHGPQELRTTEAYMALPRVAKEGQSESSTDDDSSAPPPPTPAAAPAPTAQVHAVPPQPPRLPPGELSPSLALPVSAWVEVDPARSPYAAELSSPVAVAPFIPTAWAYTVDPRPQCLGTTPAVSPTSWPKPTTTEAPAGVWRPTGAPIEAQPPTFFAAPSSGGSTPTVSHSSQEDSAFTPPWAFWGTGPSFDVVAQLCSNMESTKLVETLIKVMPEHYED